MHIVAIPGSLRAASSNRLALDAMKTLAPADLRERLRDADGLLISSPEYDWPPAARCSRHYAPV